MTDRELLELAAKAASIEGEYHYQEVLRATIEGIAKQGVDGHIWNPLANDADAFRLMVSTGVAVFPPEDASQDGSFVAVSLPDNSCPDSDWIQEMVGDGDPMDATRRAITRAAAEIQLARERA